MYSNRATLMLSNICIEQHNNTEIAFTIPNASAGGSKFGWYWVCCFLPIGLAFCRMPCGKQQGISVLWFGAFC